MKLHLIGYIARIVSRVPLYPFNYPTRRLTMEKILAKFIDEGKRELEEMKLFIKEFRTTNELLLEERSNLLSELKIEVNELLQIMGNVLIPKNKVRGVTTRGGKMTSGATPSKEINETRINKNEPPRFKQDVQEKPHDVGVKNKSLSIPERTTQPLIKPQQSSIPFPNRSTKEKKKKHNNESLGEPTPTRMSLELADRSIQYPRGIVKNVLIRVDKLVLPIDFVILDMPEDSRILIILGRPFLVTARAMIDVFNKKITLRVGDDEEIFDMDQSNTETKDKKGAENLATTYLG
ncbi:retrotransposon gag protein [Tanacetum coccineum]